MTAPVGQHATEGSHPPRWLAYFCLGLSMSLVGSYVALSKPLVAALGVFLLAWLRFGIGGLAIAHWLKRPAHEPAMTSATKHGAQRHNERADGDENLDGSKKLGKTSVIGGFINGGQFKIRSLRREHFNIANVGAV